MGLVSVASASSCAPQAWMLLVTAGGVLSVAAGAIEAGEVITTEQEGNAACHAWLT